MGIALLQRIFLRRLQKIFRMGIDGAPMISYTVREKYEPRLWRNLFGIFLLIFLAIRLYSFVIFTKI